jgi:hypothetical protein
MKKSIFKILAFCGLFCLASCEYRSSMYVDLDDPVHTTFIVKSVEKLYGESSEKNNLAKYEASNQYGYKFFIRANADSLNYGDTIIITKKQ